MVCTCETSRVLVRYSECDNDDVDDAVKVYSILDEAISTVNVCKG